MQIKLLNTKHDTFIRWYLDVGSASAFLEQHQCWASVVDGGPTLDQHWVDVSCLLGAALSKTRYTDPIPVKCWASVADDGLTLKQHWVTVFCRLHGHKLIGRLFTHLIQSYTIPVLDKIDRFKNKLGYSY